MDREPNCDSALRIDFILMWHLPCVFIHFCRAVSYITQMRFHHQLMRFHKTAAQPVATRQQPNPHQGGSQYSSCHGRQFFIHVAGPIWRTVTITALYTLFCPILSWQCSRIDNDATTTEPERQFQSLTSFLLKNKKLNINGVNGGWRLLCGPSIMHVHPSVRLSVCPVCHSRSSPYIQLRLERIRW